MTKKYWWRERASQNADLEKEMYSNCKYRDFWWQWVAYIEQHNAICSCLNKYSSSPCHVFLAERTKTQRLFDYQFKNRQNRYAIIN